MDAKFWIDAWNEGRTNFDQAEFNPKMVEYFPQLNAKSGQRILVPLCGKSKDLLWLMNQKLQVYGIEIYEEPVKTFFLENNLSTPFILESKDYKNYSYNDLTICCGDFFKLKAQESYDLIYDRAALVALPLSMRKDYAKLITKVLKPGGKYLLMTYEYDQSKMDGPPFSVSDKEIQSLYKDHFKITMMESKSALKEGPKLSALEELLHNIYILEKR